MSIRIGANPIGWSNDDLQEIGGDTPLETCLAEAKEAGVVGHGEGHKLPTDGAALQDKLAEFGLIFVGGWYSTELLHRSAREEFKRGESAYRDDQRRRDRHRDRGRNVERHSRRSFEAFVERPHLHKADWAGYGAQMTEFAERLADEGLKLCYHHHMGTIIQSERDIDALMAHTKPPVHLLLDTGHARWGGADPAGLARRLSRAHRPRALQGRARGKMRESIAGDWSFLDSILGHGNEARRLHRARRRSVLTMPRCSRSLRAIPAGSCSRPKQDPKKAPALPYAKNGVAHIRAALKEAGLV